jgi:uncharacterized protein (TIGR03066 family)
MYHARRCCVAFLMLCAFVTGSAAEQPKEKPKASAKELILGTWKLEIDDPKVKEILGDVTLEFKQDGGLVAMYGKQQLQGKYKFLEENIIEVTLEAGNIKESKKVTVEVTEKTLVTTEVGKKEQGRNKYNRLAK